MRSAPLYATPRRTDRPTTAGAAVAAAHILRRRLMPWQMDLFDIAGELIPDPFSGTMIHAYDTVVVSVGRRAGKSLSALLRCLLTLQDWDSRGWYTAQARADAAVQLRDEWAPPIRGSVLDAELNVREANGSEAIAADARASIVRLFAPVPTALHGASADWVCMDEAWAHTRERGRDLIVAARPLMATRPGAQLWIMSAAGTLESTWWADWLDKGRTAAELDTGTGICHLEWGADHPDLDLDSPDVWAAAHPAVRSAANPAGTISMDWLRTEHEADPAYFQRVYLNITDRTGATVASPVNMATWYELATDHPPDRAEGVTLGVGVAPDGESAAIVAHGYGTDGSTVELIAHAAGDTWVAERVIDLWDRYPITAVAVDPAGAGGALIAPLTAAGIIVEAPGTREVAAGCAQFTSAVATGAVRHVSHPVLDAAVEGGRRQPVGRGAWVWGWRDTDTDVQAVAAATLARQVDPRVHGTAAAIR